MNQEETFLNSRGSAGASGAEKPNKIFRLITKIMLILVLVVCAWKAYDLYWGRYCYLITAYCDCPLCINVAEYRDGKFASRRPVYWGGVAADKSVPLGSDLELVPVTPYDLFLVRRLLNDRRHFTVEDRGGKIRGRHIDIFFPQSLGGHQKALQWGVRRMRVKVNGRIMK